MPLLIIIAEEKGWFVASCRLLRGLGCGSWDLQGLSSITLQVVSAGVVERRRQQPAKLLK